MCFARTHEKGTCLAVRDRAQRRDELEAVVAAWDLINVRHGFLHHLGNRLLQLCSPLDDDEDVCVELCKVTGLPTRPRNLDCHLANRCRIARLRRWHVPSRKKGEKAGRFVGRTWLRTKRAFFSKPNNFSMTRARLPACKAGRRDETHAAVNQQRTSGPRTPSEIAAWIFEGMSTSLCLPTIALTSCFDSSTILA